MKKQLILAIVFGAIVLGLGFAGLTRAVSLQGTSFVFSEDILVTPSDLGVDNVGTLPTSNFYFLKQWGRGIERLFTFNAVSKLVGRQRVLRRDRLRI